SAMDGDMPTTRTVTFGSPPPAQVNPQSFFGGQSIVASTPFGSGTAGANTGFSSFFSKPPAPQTAQTPSFFGNTQAQIPQSHASSTLPPQSKSFFNPTSSAQSSF